MRIVVIGSGFGGLAAAIRLRAQGHDVTVVEQRDQAGGRAYVYKQDGFTFDGGPTIIPDCPISACEAAADERSAVRAMTDIAATHPLDARAVAAAEHVLLLENEHVRVLDARVAPGARTPVHAHEWPGVLYVISTSDFVRYDPEGNVLLDSRTLPRRMSPGEAVWTGPLVPHSLHNIGEAELRVIAVEIKPR